MLIWEIKNGDDELRNEIKHKKKTFDKWFERCWSNRCTKEKMLSKDSPSQWTYYLMTKPIDEIKKRFQGAGVCQCSSCGEYVGEWIETEICSEFCSDNGCKLVLCKECFSKLKKLNF